MGRKHRGLHPADQILLQPDHLKKLHNSLNDVILFLNKGYPLQASVTFSGNRFQLTARERKAVTRAAVDSSTAAKRQAKSISPALLKNKTVLIDGFNIIITLETALSNGVLLYCQDSCLRDLAGIHGSYKKVRETAPALNMAADYLRRQQVKAVKWLFDQPVSNSGRLAEMTRNLPAGAGMIWEAETVNNPDKILQQSKDIIITSDSAILDKAGQWFNLAYYLAGQTDQTNLIDLHRSAPNI
ncbi:MAG TPA: DUF434 domain-containing protein [Spirochaetota bacterium]|nr:DUF434 domain-containing protein [Spirochaetota bacterium]